MERKPFSAFLVRQLTILYLLFIFFSIFFFRADVQFGFGHSFEAKGQHSQWRAHSSAYDIVLKMAKKKKKTSTYPKKEVLTEFLAKMRNIFLHDKVKEKFKKKFSSSLNLVYASKVS